MADTEREAWLLVWDSDYGDEGEGHEYVAVYDNQSDANRARDTLPPPEGYSSRGGYGVYPVPRR